MGTDRMRRVALAVALVVLAAVAYRAWTAMGTPSGAAVRSSNPRARAAARTPDAPGTAPDVHLTALNGERPKPMPGERNLFRFETSKPVVPSGSAARPPVVTAPAVPTGPPGPPPLPPIALRFIGIIESPTQAARIAALVDNTGRTYHGAEGEVVAGQYRILRIGVESIEISYLDGRGRQTIRLSGS
jgi:hypothetical protein